MLEKESNPVDETAPAEHRVSDGLYMVRRGLVDDYRDCVVPLGDLPRILRSQTGKRASYNRLYRLAVDGDIPAERNDNHRWFVRRRDITTIARIMKLINEEVE